MQDAVSARERNYTRLFRFLRLGIWAVVLTAGFLCPAQGATTPQKSPLPTELKNAEKAIADAEALAGSGPSTGKDFSDFYKREAERKKLLPRLRKADAELTRYIEKNPKDVPALFLQVRLDLAKGLITPVEISGGKVQPQDVPTPERDPQKTLDRILEIAPSNAAAWYWKARLFAAGTAGLRGTGMDLKKAAQYARMAVEHAPDNEQYRLALAVMLTREGDRVAAKEAASRLAGGRHPLYRLLADSLKVPTPAGVVENAEFSSGWGELMMPKDPMAFVRITSYTIAGPVVEIEVFYSRTWPGLKFSPMTRNKLTELIQLILGGMRPAEGESAVEFTLLGAFFDWKEEELVLVPPDVALQREQEPGLLLLITEFHNANKAIRKHFNVGEVKSFCHLLVVNLRPVEQVR